MKNFLKLIICTLAFTTLTGCAAGSATAAYAIRASSAGKLDADAETRIVERAKREVFLELASRQQWAEQCACSE